MKIISHILARMIHLGYMFGLMLEAMTCIAVIMRREESIMHFVHTILGF